jgi:hypothetical protein
MKPFPLSKPKSTVVRSRTTRCSRLKRSLVGMAAVTAAMALPWVAQGSVEGSLIAVQTKLVGTILPLAAICGLVVAGFSFVAGHPSARSHLMLAIMGAIVGFGAESIVALIRSLIQ